MERSFANLIEFMPAWASSIFGMLLFFVVLVSCVRFIEKHLSQSKWLMAVLRILSIKPFKVEGWVQFLFYSFVVIAVIPYIPDLGKQLVGFLNQPKHLVDNISLMILIKKTIGFSIILMMLAKWYFQLLENVRFPYHWFKSEW